MKTRRHHNNKGYRQIKNDNVHKSLQHIIRKLKLTKNTKLIKDVINDEL